MPKLSCLLLTAALILPRPAFAQSEVVTPNDNLVTDGLPPVPAAIAAAARPYSEFRSAAFWDWHPTRREMIIGTRFGDAAHLLPRSRVRRVLSTHGRPLHRVHEGCRGRGVLPEVSVRRGDRGNHAAHRRE